MLNDYAMNAQLIPITRRSNLITEAAQIYTTVWNRDPEESMLFFRRYTELPDFIGYLVIVDDQYVGMGFGTISKNGQWWHDKVAEKIGINHPALQDSWVLTELAVLSAYRDLGIGAIIHDRLIYEQPHQTALLSTQTDNWGAKRFYERHGWTYIHDGFAFVDGQQHYCVMAKQVRF